MHQFFNPKCFKKFVLCFYIICCIVLSANAQGEQKDKEPISDKSTAQSISDSVVAMDILEKIKGDLSKANNSLNTLKLELGKPKKSAFSTNSIDTVGILEEIKSDLSKTKDSVKVIKFELGNLKKSASSIKSIDTAGTLSFNRIVKLYTRENIEKKITIDYIRYSVYHGNLIDIKVYDTLGNKYTYENFIPLSVFDNSAKVFKRKAPFARCRNSVVSNKVVDSAEYELIADSYFNIFDLFKYDGRSYRSFNPENIFDGRLDDTNLNKHLVREDSLNKVLSFGIYSDLLGILDKQSNPIAVMELKSRQRPLRRPLGLKKLFTLHYLEEKIRVKRFNGADEQDYLLNLKRDFNEEPIVKDILYTDPSDSSKTFTLYDYHPLNRTEIYQKSYFTFSISANILEYWINHRFLKTAHKLFLDFIYMGDLVRIGNEKPNQTSENRVVPPTYLLNSFGFQAGTDMRFSSSFNILMRYKIFRQGIFRDFNNYSYADSVANPLVYEESINPFWFHHFELKINFGHKSPIYARVAYTQPLLWMKRQRESIERKNIFYEFQVGYSQDISKIFGKLQ